MTKIDEIIKVLQQQMQMQPGLRRHLIFTTSLDTVVNLMNVYLPYLFADGEPVLFCPKWK